MPSRVPNLVPNLRVCEHLSKGMAHAGRKGRINVLPWYRLVGVAKYIWRDARRREDRAAWNQVSGRHALNKKKNGTGLCEAPKLDNARKLRGICRMTLCSRTP